MKMHDPCKHCGQDLDDGPLATNSGDVSECLRMSKRVVTVYHEPGKRRVIPVYMCPFCGGMLEQLKEE